MRTKPKGSPIVFQLKDYRLTGGSGYYIKSSEPTVLNTFKFIGGAKEGNGYTTVYSGIPKSIRLNTNTNQLSIRGQIKSAGISYPAETQGASDLSQYYIKSGYGQVSKTKNAFDTSGIMAVAQKAGQNTLPSSRITTPKFISSTVSSPLIQSQGSKKSIQVLSAPQAQIYKSSFDQLSKSAIIPAVAPASVSQTRTRSRSVSSNTLILSNMSGTSQIVTPLVISNTIPKSRNTFSSFSPASFTPSFIPNQGITGRPAFTLPKMGGFDTGSSKLKDLGSRTRFKYLPSFEVIKGFAKGRKVKGRLSGLEIRGRPKAFTFAFKGGNIF